MKAKATKAGKAAPGMVFLVGAGPGDPGLLTLRGAELLRQADVVIHDALVDPQVLAMVPATADVLYGGKRSKVPSISQVELNQLMVARARAGQCVVRLKGGDPFVFGRGGEEAEHLAAAGVAFEVVPGVSSLHAVPSYAGIPITHRDHSSCFTVITGHGDPEREGSAAYWAQFARTPGTKIILMGTDRIGVLAPTLVGQGMVPETPVGVVSWGTTGRQRTVVGTLATIAEVVAEAKIPPPSVIVIGEVVSLRERLNWFEKRPLFGQRIVVTRAREQAGCFAGRLGEMGADVLEIPVIRIVPAPDRAPIVEALAGLGAYDWVVFTSANGVGAFFDLFLKAHQDLRDVGGVRFAAVGPATAARLRALHLQVDAMPEHHVGAEVAKALAAEGSLENLRVLLVRAEVANPELPKLLEDLGAIVDDVPFYCTVADLESGGVAAERLRAEGADWVTFTSGSTVERFHERFNLLEMTMRYPGMQLASIGPETTKALAELGLKAHLEANPHTTEAMVAALCLRPKANGPKPIADSQ